MNAEHERRYDSSLPEDVIVRYRWGVLDRMSWPDISPSQVQIEGHMRFLELHDSVSRPDSLDDFFDPSHILPGEFDGSGLELSEWCNQWRLVPLRMLNRGLPEIEILTPQYVHELFHTALLGQQDHVSCCKERSGAAGVDCETSLTCPALVAKEIGLRTVGLALLDVQTIDRTQDPEALAHDRMLVKEFYRAMKRYGLIENAIEYNSFLTSINDHLEAIFSKPLDFSSQD